ncbi:MAG: 30S ribosomal protein S17, partial [Nanoarchaeota archaeon]
MKTEQARSIGVKVPFPGRKCDDSHCPFHSTISLRGRILEGNIAKNIFHKTAVVEFNRQLYIPKFERYAIRK